MSDPDKLTHLLRLLDDDSDVVQEALKRELDRYGLDLESQIARLDLQLSSEHWRRLAQLRAGSRRTALRNAWPTWFELGEDLQLETAQSLLADFIEARPRPGHLTNLLDELAEDFISLGRRPDCYELAMYLFEEQGIRGERADYYAPINSSLSHVIEEKRGNPISLSCVYMLTGARLGIPIRALNFPGHFMARAQLGNETVVIDCYSGARFMSTRSFAELTPHEADPERYLNEEVTAGDIIRRVLNNLVNSYTILDEIENAELMAELRDQTWNEDVGIL